MEQISLLMLQMSLAGSTNVCGLLTSIATADGQVGPEHA